MFTDYYEILGIEINASEDQIKKAYRLNAVKYHPDKHFDDPFFTKKFQEILSAYNILIDNDKRGIFDVEYRKYYKIFNESTNQRPYVNSMDNSYGFTNYTEKNKPKQPQEQEDEEFKYDPYKQFYSSHDRDSQETPQFNPALNFWGERLSDKLEFFKLPNRIGKIIVGYSNLIKDKQPLTSAQKIKKNALYISIGLVIGAIIFFLFQLQEPIWIFIWFVVPPALLIYISDKTNKFKHTNLYVGINGFAHFTCEDKRDNLSTDIEINFNEMTDFYAHYTEVRRNYNYQHTSYVFICLNRKNMKKLYGRAGDYSKKMSVKQQGEVLNFCRTIERYWTVFLLDKLEQDLQETGYISFSLYSHEKNIISTYIKLGIGYITFLKQGGQEFTYRFNDIKKIYSKGSELRIQHKNFEKSLFFFKSGNEDVIPMTNLCNRQFFYKAMEILLGYSL